MMTFLEKGRCCPGQEVIMLDTYFKAPFTLKRLRSGPSGPFIDGFAGSLKTAGYSWWTARSRSEREVGGHQRYYPPEGTERAFSPSRRTH